MNDKQRQQLVDYVEDARNLESVAAIDRWSNRILMFLTAAMGADVAGQFRNILVNTEYDELAFKVGNEYDELAFKVGYIEGLIAKGEDKQNLQHLGLLTRDEAERMQIGPAVRKVFVVHGHDGEAKETVARFLEKLELEPIILHEQPNQGRTVIEKFETSSSDVAFAVVLLTPDDLGRSANGSPNLCGRARQNVILELGFFLGRLGRTRVCALHRGGVELPSDFQGVVYIEFDPAGAWRTKLAQEFVEAKLTIKIEGLINK